ncbi:MAG: phage head-tail connector protein [Pseudomonadota bacterium]
MTYKVVTAVATECVSLAEARVQLRMTADDTTADDALITALITAAREFAEHYTGRALAPQTLEMALDEFPADGIDLDMPPVATITSVKYTDTAGAEQTVSSTDYALSLYGDSRRLSLAYGATWPSTQDIADAVRIRYVTGYTTAPKAVKAAILLDIELRYNKLMPSDQAAYEKARDALLGTVKIWGF